MFEIKLIETFDGKRHETKSDALHHLEEIYGDKLSKVSRDIIQLLDYKDRYLKVIEFIDNNLELFVELSEIKADMKSK
jgi:hypothetical protein